MILTKSVDLTGEIDGFTIVLQGKENSRAPRRCVLHGNLALHSETLAGRQLWVFQSASVRRQSWPNLAPPSCCLQSQHRIRESWFTKHRCRPCPPPLLILLTSLFSCPVAPSHLHPENFHCICWGPSPQSDLAPSACIHSFHWCSAELRDSALQVIW